MHQHIEGQTREIDKHLIKLTGITSCVVSSGSDNSNSDSKLQMSEGDGDGCMSKTS